MVDASALGGASSVEARLDLDAMPAELDDGVAEADAVAPELDAGAAELDVRGVVQGV
jgi:hypothetical protein